MAPQKTALAFLALLSVAGAERSLLNKPQGGSSLHGIAVTTANYFTTNGNGTWVNVLTGNNPAAAANANVNTAFNTAVSAPGAQSTFASGAVVNSVLGAVGAAGSSLYGPGYDGITAVAFPSRLMGVAVGLGLGSATTLTSPQLPNIITTFDQGLTWMAVTGFGPQPSTTVTGGAEYIAPDLASVYCASRTLCWAVGGYYPVGASGTALAFQAAASLPAYGTILTSTNGGTFWNYATAPTANPLSPAGGLAAVASDSSGRNVYAVGHPSVPATTANTAFTNDAFSVTIGAGTILFSPSYGVSGTWVGQTAPVLSGYFYSLVGVTVLRGTVAFACGGNPFGAYTSSTTTLAANGNGIILGTNNGGFSWLPQSLPSYANSAISNLGGSSEPGLSQGAGTLPTINALASYTTNGTNFVWGVGDIGYAVMYQFPSSSINTNSYGKTQTWSLVTALGGSSSFYGITWENNKVGYVYGAGLIMSTHDSGKTWQAETPNFIIIGTSNTPLNVLALATAPTTY